MILQGNSYTAKNCKLSAHIYVSQNVTLLLCVAVDSQVVLHRYDRANIFTVFFTALSDILFSVDIYF